MIVFANIRINFGKRALWVGESQVDGNFGEEYAL